MSPQAAAPQTMKTLVDEFVEQRKRKSELEKQLREVANRIAEIEPNLLEVLAANALTRVGHDESGMTVYVRRDTRVKNMGDDRADACVALKAAGLGSYVAESFNLHSLSAYFREQIKDRIEDGEVVEDPNVVLPEALHGHIELVDLYSLRAKKS